LNRLVVLAASVLAVTAVMAQGAFAAATATTTGTTTTATPTVPPSTTTTITTAPAPPPSSDTTTPGTGVTVTPAPTPKPKPSGQGGKQHPSADGGAQPQGKQPTEGESDKNGKEKGKGRRHKDNGGSAGAGKAGPISVPVYPSIACGIGGAPPALQPIYQRASDAYGLGPQGPGILAAINGIESGFGANLGPSSAGAVGWMQFMPSTWDVYGLDANGDGKADPNNPQDAIFAAASYLRAAGMPFDTPGAIFAYNHADWYVAEVLANAGCYGALDGTFSLTPGKPVIACTASDDNPIPERYLHAFEQAAGQYELGRRGVWALASVARLESDFGNGMSAAQIRAVGPLGIDRDEWNRFEIDGNGDGLIRPASIEDSSATLAREIWSQGSLRAGLFLHNQAAWYVDQVMQESDQIAGRCRARTVEWNVALPGLTSAPINWANLTLSNRLEMHDIQSGALDPRIMSLLGMITQTHKITLTATRSDHSEFTAEGNVSNHFFGRAMDIGAVDGVPCTDTAPSAPCGELGRTLTLLPAPIHPTELIYCFDLDGPGPAFARADHCNHVHVGFDG
jgi:hypothetical protein